MKEIIEGLNLPKQIFDKTEKLMSKLFGPSIKEFGELFADKVRFRRLKNQVKILNKTRLILEENGLEARELGLKTVVNLVEKSSLEEDEPMQNKWAKLIANISATPENGLEQRMINTLGALSSLEAQILDFIYEDFFVQRQVRLARLLKSPLLNLDIKYTEKDIKLEDVIINFEAVKDNFSLEEEFTNIYIENLISLGLLKYEEPDIDIDGGSSSADLDEDDIDLNLDLSANYNTSDNFTITPYGHYFIRNCKLD